MDIEKKIIEIRCSQGNFTDFRGDIADILKEFKNQIECHERILNYNGERLFKLENPKFHSQEELKPCPFCGSTMLNVTKDANDEFRVWCGICEAESGMYKSSATARDSWNRRSNA